MCLVSMLLTEGLFLKSLMASPLCTRALLEGQDFAHCRGLVSEGALFGGDLALARHLRLVVGLEPSVGEREEESHHLVDLFFTQSEWLDAAVEKRIRFTTLVVMVHDVPQGGHRAVVHVRRGDSDVAHLRAF